MLRPITQHPVFGDVVSALRNYGAGRKQAEEAVKAAALDTELHFDALFRRAVKLLPKAA